MPSLETPTQPGSAPLDQSASVVPAKIPPIVNRAVALPSPDGHSVVLGARRGLVDVAVHAPTAVDCLRCQLLGRRRLTCQKADACAALPQSFAVGPILLGAWLITTIAFIIAVL